MATSPRANDPATVEALFLACLCREPEFWLLLQDFDETDIDPANPAGRALLKTGLDLLTTEHNPTCINLARHGIQHEIESYEVLQQRAEMAEESVRLDFLDIMAQVKGESLRRQNKTILSEGHAQLSRCSVFDVPRVAGEIQSRLARLEFTTDRDENHDIGSIVDRLMAGDAAVGKPMPTRWRWWNELSGGGLHAKYLWAIGGAPGKRKTTFLYNLGLDWAEMGYRIMHIAIDGGDKFQQGVKYLTLMWEKVCLEDSDIDRNSVGDIVYYGKRADGAAYQYSYIRPKTVRQLIDPKTYGKINFPIPPRVMACWHEAVARMRRYKSSNDGGWIRLFDAGDIWDGNVMVRRLRVEQTVLGIDAFFLDHIGEVAGEGKNQFERQSAVTSALVQFKNRYSSRAVILSQRTEEANWKDEEDKERPGLVYGQKLVSNADLIGITDYDPNVPHEFSIALYKNREDEHGTNVKARFRIIPASGLILERGK